MSTLPQAIQKAAAHVQAGRLTEAIFCYQQALRLAPMQPELHMDIGNVLLANGDRVQAQHHFQEAVTLRPGFAEAHYNLALVQGDQGQTQAALQGYTRAIDLKPDLLPAHVNLGNIYRDMNQAERAISCYRRALALDPEHVNTLINLGSLLRALGRAPEAEPYLQQAVTLQPHATSMLEQLGTTLIDLLRYEEALGCFQQLLYLQPASPETWCNTGAALNLLGYYDEAIAHYDRALDLDPNHACARWNRALLYLLKGRWTEGWADFKWRWQTPAGAKAYPHRYQQALWQGESFVDQRLLVHYEQGLGDVLQFLRYLPLVKPRGGTVLLEVPRPIVGLIQNWDCVDEIVVSRRDRPVDHPFDKRISLMDLPALFQTTLENLPAPVPYLIGDPEKVAFWHRRLDGPGYKIGIVWAGGAVHHERLSALRLRACRLEHFAPLADIPGTRWFGLQKGTGLDELGQPHAAFLTENLGEAFADFTDTAAAITALDLVISIDTSVAHLAGALGKPCWTVLKFDADWRWLLDRDDSPWYPSMRLFRQERNETWPTVFTRIRGALERFAQDRDK